MRVGVDVGGTKTLAVAVDEAGRVLGVERRPTGRGAAAVVEGIAAVVEVLAGEGTGAVSVEVRTGAPPGRGTGSTSSCTLQRCRVLTEESP